MSILFDPLQVGDLLLKNRIVMSPLTRCRASEGRVPNALMVEYYRQRASAGLIISEATAITPMGVGYPNTPGIWSAEQIEGWRQVTAAVHNEGGLIVLQLWHVGRISDPDYLDGQLPEAPSAIAAAGQVSLLQPKRDFVTPRAMALEEVNAMVECYKVAAENAKAAGFDGVEVHAANGYLIDQFLQDSTNKREDDYGGSIENRARFLLEVTDACISVWGAGKVGVHLSPRSDTHDMGDSSAAQTFGYVAAELGERRVAFICAREYLGEDSLGQGLKQKFGGVYIVNEKFNKESAEQVINRGLADAVAFGIPFIANPDLVARFKSNAQLNPPQFETFYGSGAAGYIDYPFL